MGVEGDASDEGDTFPDAAAQSGSRDAALDQALSGAPREGLSRHGVIRKAEGFVERPEVRTGGGGRRGGWAT